MLLSSEGVFYFSINRLEKKRIDQSEILTLDSIRHSLIRQEDSIIFSLLERAQYCYNADTYDSNAFDMDGFEGSLVEFMVRETEKLHAQVSGDEREHKNCFFFKKKNDSLWILCFMFFNLLLAFFWRSGDTRARMSILSFQKICLSPCCHLCSIQR